MIVNHAPQQKHTPAKFESPFIGKEKSHYGSYVPPSTPTNRFATTHSGSPHQPAQGLIQNLDDLNTPPRKRKRKKFSPFDDEIVLSHREMKAGASNVNVLTRTVNLRAVEVRREHAVYMSLDLAACYLHPTSYQEHPNPWIYCFRCTLSLVGND